MKNLILMFKLKDKRGIVFSLQTILIIFIVAVVAVFSVNWFMGMGGARTATPLTAQPPTSVPPQAGQPIQPVSLVEDVTVTFSSWDFYSKSTNAGTGHRILSAGDNLVSGDINLQLNDDAQRIYSPGQSYSVLLGNLTEALGNAQYYPSYISGIFIDKGTFTVGKGQYGVATPSEMTFTFFDETDTATTTAQAVGSGSKTVVGFQLKAPDNQCLGNPDTGGKNIATYHYNQTTFSKIVQLNSDGSDALSVATPNGATINTTINVLGKTKVSYEYPIVCDNQLLKTKVRIETVTGTAGDADGNQDINITMSDISFDYNADTLSLITGYVDESNNDLGFVDTALIGSLIVS